MAGQKKRKHAEVTQAQPEGSGSRKHAEVTQAQPEGSGGSSESDKDDKMSEVMTTLESFASALKADLEGQLSILKAEMKKKADLEGQLSILKAEMKKLEDNNTLKFNDHTLKLKKMRPVLKKYVRDRALFLVNEFLSFIGQIHKTGLQRKFNKKYSTGKFQKLIENPEFSSNCNEFLLNVDGKSKNDIIEMFNNICDNRNREAHFEEPEDCLQAILKFKTKYSDMLCKCQDDVQFCLAQISGIANHFIGPYRLQRLACEFLASFLSSRGHSWNTIAGLGKILDKNEKLFDKFIPEGVSIKQWKRNVKKMFKTSMSFGPTFGGNSNEVDTDYSSIQKIFQKCLRLGMFPERGGYRLEFHILGCFVEPGQSP